MGKGRQFDAAFKSKVALAAIKGDHTISELSSQYKVHSTQISAWKKHALSHLNESFSAKKPGPKNPENDEGTDGLYAKIGRLEMENDFLKKVLGRS